MREETAYINVAVTLPLFNTYTYRVPGYLTTEARPGKRVLVPFNRRRLTGYILGPDAPSDPHAVKEILDILDDQPLFPAALIPFYQWIADYYICPLGEVIKTALPGGLLRQDVDHLAITPLGQEALKNNTVTQPAVKAVLQALEAKPATRKALARHLKQELPLTLLRRLAHQGLISWKQSLSRETSQPRQVQYARMVDEAPFAYRVSEAGTKVLQALTTSDAISVEQLRRITPSAPRLLKKFASDGLVDLFHQNVLRDPLGDPILPDHIPLPSMEQYHVINRIGAQLGKGFAAYLLTGVTGSGKTEVYLQLAAQVRERREKVLVLVPEIALIASMARAFRARFGEQVAVLHSGLSAGERYDQWQRLLTDQATIAIGARSAIFVPWERIGLIVVDEEHDASYKQESGLRYQARDLAVVRARLDNCVVLLGSATPSVQSYYNAQSGKYIGLQMTRRVADRALPEIQLVDLRQQMRAARGPFWFSPPLRQAIQETLDRQEQVLLFVNRRGFASVALCRDCGKPLMCRHCNVSLTYHKDEQRFVCHYCGYGRVMATTCPECRGQKFKLTGVGTEKIQELAEKLFPAARIARMDRDTTRRKGALVKLLKGLHQQTIDLLIGTQMVAKGHDFPHITLVGIICADISLNIPDFRSSERTFQLLAQVAGRAGRGTLPGRVILQTFTPEHFSITTARDQDYAAFYAREIGFRQSLAYPPYSRLIALKITGRNADLTRQCAQSIGQLLKTAARQHDPVTVLGPIEATVARVADYFRWQIVLKSSQTTVLRHLIHQTILSNPDIQRNQRVQVGIDVDPYFF